MDETETTNVVHEDGVINVEPIEPAVDIDNT